MGFSDALKRLLIGRKLASDQLGETLLPKRIALPVFASDALSSVAYAPDEIILTLSLAGMAGFSWDWKIGLMVGFVMLIVVMSYRQTVHAYPSGGGDYEVATTNLGANAGLTVASALLVDYILTVAVSVSSGVQNAKAMLPWITGHEGIIAAVIILTLMAINLRGVRESGTLFAVPVYCFMIGILGMTAWGLVRIFLMHDPLRSPMAAYTVVGASGYEPFAGFAMIALLAKTFSSGCAALTGVEAISNGVPAFKKPKSKNAATTLALLGTLAVSMLMGIITLAHQIQARMVDDMNHESYFVDATGKAIAVEPITVVGQLAMTIFSSFRPGFYFVIIATFVILFLAANTAFNGFPVLGSILAKDGYLPRQLHSRGDRLAYSNGIIVLAVAAVSLVLAFNASVTALIQLYVVGVFVSFTVSQTGMIIHWTRLLRTETDPAARRHAQRSRIINAIGLTMTGIVLVVVLLSKFLHGAYIAIVAMIVLFVLMRGIRHHYSSVEREVALSGADERALPSRFHAIVMVTEINKPTLRALQFARGCRPHTLEAVTVAVDDDETIRTVRAWDDANFEVPLKVIASPYREVAGPFINYVKSVRTANPRDIVCVYIPEYVVGHWWEQLLHNQTALFVRARLHFTPNVLTASVPYLLRSSRYAEERMERPVSSPWAHPPVDQPDDSKTEVSRR